MAKFIDILVQARPVGPDLTFVEIETPNGKSTRIGEWHEAPGGYARIRITPEDISKLEEPE